MWRQPPTRVVVLKLWLNVFWMCLLTFTASPKHVTSFSVDIFGYGGNFELLIVKWKKQLFLCKHSLLLLPPAARTLFQYPLNLHETSRTAERATAAFLRPVAESTGAKCVSAARVSVCQLCTSTKPSCSQSQVKICPRPERDGDLNSRTKMETVEKNADTFLR